MINTEGLNMKDCDLDFKSKTNYRQSDSKEEFAIYISVKDIERFKDKIESDVFLLNELIEKTIPNGTDKDSVFLGVMVEDLKIKLGDIDEEKNIDDDLNDEEKKNSNTGYKIIKQLSNIDESIATGQFYMNGFCLCESS